MLRSFECKVNIVYAVWAQRALLRTCVVECVRRKRHVICEICTRTCGYRPHSMTSFHHVNAFQIFYALTKIELGCIAMVLALRILFVVLRTAIPYRLGCRVVGLLSPRSQQLLLARLRLHFELREAKDSLGRMGLDQERESATCIFTAFEAERQPYTRCSAPRSAAPWMGKTTRVLHTSL